VKVSLRGMTNETYVICHWT